MNGTSVTCTSKDFRAQFKAHLADSFKKRVTGAGGGGGGGGGGGPGGGGGGGRGGGGFRCATVPQFRDHYIRVSGILRKRSLISS